MALPPGVPSLLPQFIGAFAAPLTLLTADLFSGYGSYLPPQWGLYDGGEPVVIAESVRSFGYKQDWNVSDYPVEGGGFESYNKVNTPYAIQLEFATGGTAADRAELLESLALAADSLDLYDVVTPEVIYVGVNVVHYTLSRRAQRGANFVAVDVWVLEIREQGSTDIKNAKYPGGYSIFQGGNVQPYTAPASAAPQISAVT